MGMIKVLWNIFNLAYSIMAVVFAYQRDEMTLRVISMMIFWIHFFFIMSLNSYTSQTIREDSKNILDCLMILENCSVIMLSAMLIIFASNDGVTAYSLPIICYISILHVVCLSIACLKKKGYHYLSLLCHKRLCDRCECSQEEKSKMNRLCSKLENCFLTAITCSYCCKR